MSECKSAKQAVPSFKSAPQNWALNSQTGHSSDDSKQCPVCGDSAQLVPS